MKAKLVYCRLTGNDTGYLEEKKHGVYANTWPIINVHRAIMDFG